MAKKGYSAVTLKIDLISKLDKLKGKIYLGKYLATRSDIIEAGVLLISKQARRLK